MYWKSITQDKTENKKKKKQHGILCKVEVTERCENSSLF